MALFGFKKKNVPGETCSCGGKCAPAAVSRPENGTAGVKILGGGCEKCRQLEETTAQALAELGMDTAIEHVTDFAQIAAYGVMTTPALVVDGKVLSYGKVLKKAEAVKLLKEARG